VISNTQQSSVDDPSTGTSLPEGDGDRPLTAHTIRAATDADVPEILRLIDTSYDRQDDLLRLRYWRWKHEANPFGASPCLVAESNGRLVGVRVFLRWAWQSGDRTVRAVRAVDTATHPEWRGRGIFSRLTLRLVEQMQREGISFVYNTPNAKSMPGYLKMGWSRVGRVPLWIRPHRVSRAVRRSLTQRHADTPVLKGLDTVPYTLQEERLPAFLSDVAPVDDRYHTARTLPYLSWRYGDIPGLTYRARFDTAGDSGALLVARGRRRGRLREVTISELLVTPSPRGIELARHLLSALLSSADADYVVACAAPGTAERSVLARSGFVPVPRVGPHFTARRLAPDAPDPSTWASWRCSIGDLELF